MKHKLRKWQGIMLLELLVYDFHLNLFLIPFERIKAKKIIVYCSGSDIFSSIFLCLFISKK